MCISQCNVKEELGYEKGQTECLVEAYEMICFCTTDRGFVLFGFINGLGNGELSADENKVGRIIENFPV